MNRFSIPTECGERLVLGRRRKSEEAQICLPPPLRHTAEQLFHVLTTLFRCALFCFFSQSFSSEHLLEIGCCFPAL